jgi:hypothetical protein
MANEFDRVNAEVIVVASGGLALALDLVGAYIVATGCDLPDYVRDYQKRNLELGWRNTISEEYPDAVAVILSLTLEKIEKLNSVASALLRFCAFLAPTSIPEEIISGIPDRGNPLGAIATNASKLSEAVILLQQYSVLQRDAEAKTLSIHHFVQAVLKNSLSQKAQYRQAERAVRAMNSMFLSSGSNVLAGLIALLLLKVNPIV